VRLAIQIRIWRRAIPAAWEQTTLLEITRIALSVAVASLNILWRGHGILRAAPALTRFVVVGVGCYLVTTIAEFLWLISTGPRFTGFESPAAEQEAAATEQVDAMVEELRALPPAELREETLEFAKELKDFEAGADREFVRTLTTPPAVAVFTESARDEALDKQSVELMENNLLTGRVYREKFYRPARAFRDELRKRLGIRNLNNEPRIPALDRALLTGARPIAQAADYLAGLARRLK
jgi:hypothetical protein